MAQNNSKAVSMPLPSDLTANHFKVILPSRKGKITKKVPFVSASENSILMEEAKWTNAERIKKENDSWWECRITHTT